MNHLIYIPIFYFIFITIVICLIHTFIPDYPIDRYKIKSRLNRYKIKSRRTPSRFGQGRGHSMVRLYLGNENKGTSSQTTTLDKFNIFKYTAKELHPMKVFIIS